VSKAELHYPFMAVPLIYLSFNRSAVIPKSPYHRKMWSPNANNQETFSAMMCYKYLQFLRKYGDYEVGCGVANACS